MDITIAERLLPYSHLPGTSCVLPGSYLKIQIFPTLLVIEDIFSELTPLLAEIQLGIEGPVEGFTVQLDLEKGLIRIWGTSAKGFFRYRLHAGKDSPYSLVWIEEKNLLNELTLDLSIADSKFLFSMDTDSIYTPPFTERLSLGSHKAQDWQMVMRRKDARDLFPIWQRLGRLIPREIDFHNKGTAAWLTKCEAASEKLDLLKPFLNLFLAGFEGIFSPRLEDNQYQGLELSQDFVGDDNSSPLFLLQEGSRLIRSLFFKIDQEIVTILPLLPSEFHCGRFINLRCGDSLLDMEWSKGIIRRMILRGNKQETFLFQFPKDIRQYRLRKGFKDKGTLLTNPSLIAIQQGQEYFFDKFQK